MNKTALRKFAVQARKKLVDAVKQKAYLFGITEQDITPLQELPDGLVINGAVLGERELKQYTHLKNRILLKGYNAVMEEAAYTWFNRFVALRYMEVNDFLPIHMRILSSETLGKTEPDALTNILSLIDELGLNREHVYQLQDANKFNDLYQYLLVKQSNKLGEIIPNVFEPITDDLALLLPDHLLNENSVVRDVVTLIDEEDWTNVEIVGWLYQFYISEQKDEVFSNLKKNKKIGKEDIGPATQLFTPRWIVEYMVDNSLGRLWLESHPDEDLQSTLEYFLEDAEQTEEVRAQLDALKDPNLDIESIKFLDPACGSGHILVYAFELFYKIYLSRGYLEREIPKLILENNLYGLDIDERAAQLATFAVVMKAREKDRRLFSREYTVHVHSIEESNAMTSEEIELFAKGNDEIFEETEKLVTTFNDAKLYGSIIQVPEINIDLLEKQMEYIRNEAALDMFTTDLIEYRFPLLEDLIHQYRILENQYEVVVTNPPYMGSKGMDSELSKYVKKHYPNEKSDMFAVMMRCMESLSSENGFIANVTMQSWMFLSSYEKFRKHLLEKYSIVTMTHMNNMVMGIAFGTAATIFRNKIEGYKGKFSYVKYEDIIDNAPKKFPVTQHRYNEISSEKFGKIPGSPIVYWMPEKSMKIFDFDKINDYFVSGGRTKTHNNEKYVRYFWEVSPTEKWTSYDNGGEFIKFYGNNYYLVDTSMEAVNFYEKKGGMPNEMYKNRLGITWNLITSKTSGFRIKEPANMYSSASPTIFPKDEEKRDLLYNTLGFLNSKISKGLLKMINPTLNTTVGDILKLPIINVNKTISIVKKSIFISKSNWNTFETSRDFKKHPFLEYPSKLIIESFSSWEKTAKEQFYQMKFNEEELNRVFIDIYGLQDELTPEVEEKDITVRKADRTRDVKSFLSYLVGLMFGRYSLNHEGLAYAGGEWEPSLYTQFQPDENNIIPLTAEEHFEDDIVKKVEELVTLIYGEETLEENLLFIAEALNKKANESARDRIRRYFINDFYKDHLQTYQKRPIYWQFSSGKRGAFKGLMYLHRYDRDTIARLRTDCVLKESKVLDNLIALEQHVVDDDSSSSAQKARAQKAIENYLKDKTEITQYAELLDHVARQRIELDLDDGVKVNYAKFQNIEAIQDQSGKVVKLNVLEKIK